MTMSKHLMTGPKGNSEFCFPKTLNVSWSEAEGNLEVEGKQNSLFPVGSVMKCFVIHVPPNTKLEKKNWEEIVFLMPTGSQVYIGLKKHNLIMCELKVQVLLLFP